MYEELTPSESETTKNNTKENHSEDTKENIKEEVRENNEENAKEDLVDQKGDYKIVNEPNYSVSIENGNAKWLDYEREDTLQNINLKVHPGELIAIVGQVGSGKTSLLNVILKELRLQEGSIQVC